MKKKREENKKEKKRKEKKVGCLIFENEIEEVRGFFLGKLWHLWDFPKDSPLNSENFDI